MGLSASERCVAGLSGVVRRVQKCSAHVSSRRLAQDFAISDRLCQNLTESAGPERVHSESVLVQGKTGFCRRWPGAAGAGRIARGGRGV